MAKKSIFGKSLCGVVLSLVFALGAAAGTLAPGYSEGEGEEEEIVSENRTPLGDIRAPAAGDGSKVSPENKTPLGDFEQPKSNPDTGDNMTPFAVLSLAIFGAAAYFAKKSKKAK